MQSLGHDLFVRALPFSFRILSFPEKLRTIASSVSERNGSPTTYKHNRWVKLNTSEY